MSLEQTMTREELEAEEARYWGEDLGPDRDGGIVDAVAAVLRRYVAFPTPAALTAVTLWTAHTHALDAFESTPRLALLSPEKQSGKTRTLEVLEGLCPNPMHAVNCTPAALFRAVAATSPTLLFDEADTYFGPRAAQNYEELRGLINAGHRRGAVAYRCVGPQQEVREFPAFAAVAVAGIGDMPDTVTDRSVVIGMRRRGPHEVVSQFRERKARPELHAVRDRLAAWVKQNLDLLAESEPEMPEGITDRPADVWEPLLAIADVAGGEWPARARAAAVEMNTTRAKADTSLGVKLLIDIKSVFNGTEHEKLFTETILEKLNSLDESPWGDIRGKALDARGLARRLYRYDIRPKQVRVGDATKKGYDIADFHDAWDRYLALDPENRETGETSETVPPDREEGVSVVSSVSLSPGSERWSLSDATVQP